MLPLRYQPLYVADNFLPWKHSHTSRYYFNLLTLQNLNAGRRPHCQLSCSEDRRSRLSKLWAPSGGIAPGTDEAAHSKLIRAGFIRQAHSGIFHMLPLGYRVQKKVEKLIDKHMYTIGASKLNLSSISSEALWEKSGRNGSSELFRFMDRRDIEYLLSPTHEEEITNLVANTVKSYKDLPARLFQISRKYRDELRPRYGLLRSREFIMKDLYTFDYSKDLALKTYEQVCAAYEALFNELKIPYLVAEADSGDMGGTLSHEFQFTTSKGEDQVVSCESCCYVANEEKARNAIPLEGVSQEWLNWMFVVPEKVKESSISPSQRAISVWRGLSSDKLSLINVWYPLDPRSSNEKASAFPQSMINTHAVKEVVPELDPGLGNVERLWIQNLEQRATLENNKSSITGKIINLIDCRIPKNVWDAMILSDPRLSPLQGLVEEKGLKVVSSIISRHPRTHEPINLLQIQNGDKCPRCSKGRLKVQPTIELGHTFFLGDRYSGPLEAVITIPMEAQTGSTHHTSQQVPIQMGCYGIGVSRMIGAVADILADTKGLNWPRVIAPFEVVIVPTLGNELEADIVFDSLVMSSRESSNNTSEVLDMVIDDRSYAFPWKMRDADLIGYPIIVVVGRDWKSEKICEVQCRRLGIRENISCKTLYGFIRKLLTQL